MATKLADLIECKWVGKSVQLNSGRAVVSTGRFSVRLQPNRSAVATRKTIDPYVDRRRRVEPHRGPGLVQDHTHHTGRRVIFAAKVFGIKKPRLSTAWRGFLLPAAATLLSQLNRSVREKP